MGRKSLNTFFIFPSELLFGKEVYARLVDDFKETDQLLFKVLLMHWAGAITIIPMLFSNLTLGFVGGGTIVLFAYIFMRKCNESGNCRMILSTCLVLFTFLFIFQSKGKIESHFHFWIVLGILLTYKDIRPLLWVSSLFLALCTFFFFLQRSGLQIAGRPLVLFDNGAKGFNLLLQFVFVIPSTVLFMRIATRHIKSFIETSELTLHLDRTVKQRLEEIEQQKKEILKQNKDLDDFASIISHDLKAPLRSVTGLVKILTDEHSTELSPEVMDLIALIQNRTVMMDNLINGIISYSRLNQIESQTNQFPLLSILGDIKQSLGKQTGMQFQFPSDDVVLYCSYFELYLVLINLLDNAVKYHDKEKGKIAVNFEEKGDWYHFTIMDDGPGIPEEFYKKIFVIFETVRNHSAIKSSGIGLAIVKKLVERNGGTVGVESELTRGTSFWFTWPKGTID